MSAEKYGNNNEQQGKELKSRERPGLPLDLVRKIEKAKAEKLKKDRAHLETSFEIKNDIENFENPVSQELALEKSDELESLLPNQNLEVESAFTQERQELEKLFTKESAPDIERSTQIRGGQVLEIIRKGSVFFVEITEYSEEIGIDEKGNKKAISVNAKVPKEYMPKYNENKEQIDNGFPDLVSATQYYNLVLEEVNSFRNNK